MANYFTRKMNNVVTLPNDGIMYSRTDGTLASARQLLVDKLQNDCTPRWMKRRAYIQWWLDNTPSPYKYIYDEKRRLTDVVRVDNPTPDYRRGVIAKQMKGVA